MRSPCPALLSVPVVVLLSANGAGAQEAVPKDGPAVKADVFEADAPGLKISADLSWVVTTGNSRTATVGFGSELSRRWERHGLLLSASGTRASSSRGLSFAVGDVSDFEVVRPDPEPTVEYYKLRGRYDHRVSERLFVLAGSSWERNRFSGLRSRLVAEGGFGFVVAASEATDFRATAGLTYTNNQEVVPNPALENNFAGARVSWTLKRRLTDTASLVHDLVLDENLKQTDDFRADLGLGLSVSISTRLALKASHRLLFRNLPALEQLPLRDAAGVETGSVAAPLRKVDQGLSVSLVFSFERSDGE
jgi:Protein of unknown function, DUF481